MDEKLFTEVAEKEKIEVEKLKKLLEENKAVLACSNNRPAKLSKPCAIGESLSVKVNANIGTAQGFEKIGEELEKLKAAVDAGADTVMDLSTGGDLDLIRREIIGQSEIPVGTVPIYQAAIEAIEDTGSIVSMDKERLFDVIEKHAADGVDFMTVHCGMTWKALKELAANPRITDIVSRGGAFLAGWMIYNNKENPLYEHFDRLLEIACKYGVVLSLGDAMRPGCLADSGDRAQHSELYTIGELVEECKKNGVQAIVEGPGHVPMNEIESSVKTAKTLTSGAPLYLLGPLVTDIGAGHDHITGAIGGAIAAMHGADFLCYVTPKEHLGLPTADDVREGVVASKIAAHAADIARGVSGSRNIDDEMSGARKKLDWEKQLELCIDRRGAKMMHKERKNEQIAGCTMCGGFCAMELVGEYLKNR